MGGAIPHIPRNIVKVKEVFLETHYPYTLNINTIADVEVMSACRRFAAGLDGYIEAKGPMDVN